MTDLLFQETTLRPRAPLALESAARSCRRLECH